MKSLVGENIAAAITFVASLLSTSYAHTGPRFLGGFAEQQEDTRVELNNSSVFVEMDLKVENKMLRFIKSLNCSRVR